MLAWIVTNKEMTLNKSCLVGSMIFKYHETYDMYLFMYFFAFIWLVQPQCNSSQKNIYIYIHLNHLIRPICSIVLKRVSSLLDSVMALCINSTLHILYVKSFIYSCIISSSVYAVPDHTLSQKCTNWLPKLQYGLRPLSDCQPKSNFWPI